MSDNDTSVDILEIFAEDKSVIAYRPRWNKLTGSVLATILLQQINYWWRGMDQQPFYKFAAPCQHRRYKDGDSWQEELGFTKHELRTALGKIAKKITKGVSKNEALKTHLVVYWTDRNRMTWYEVNEPLLREKLIELYSCNSGIRHYIGSAENQQNMENPDSGNTCSETTPETTTDNNGSAAGERESESLTLLAVFGVRRTKKVRRLAALYDADQVGRVIEAARVADVENPQGLVVSMLEDDDIPPEPDPPITYAGDDLPEPEPVDPALARARETWRTALGELELQLDRHTFATWLKPARALTLDDGTLTVEVPNAQVKEWLDARLRRTIDRAVATVAGGVTVEFVTLEGER